MANIRNSRLIFIDSEVNTVGNQSKAKINLPNHPFSVCCEDRMRLTLLSFDMRRSWYSVNQTNNVFYLRDPDADTYTEIVIAPGSYSTFASLAAAIQDGTANRVGGARRVPRRHFFIRDMVEAFELNVPLVSTVNNYADFFTKTLKPGSFSSMRNKIMNIKSVD